MENRELEKTKEITLIKKGFFYYLWKGLIFPFKIIYKAIIPLTAKTKEINQIIKENKEKKIKLKRLYKIIERNNDEEII